MKPHMNQNINKVDYHDVTFNGRTIKFRKWKVKDKKALDKCENEIQKRKVYVYNCLENQNEPLDIEEYNYVLANIRDYSLDKELEYELVCPHCNENKTISMKASEAVVFKDANYEPLVHDDIIIEIGPIKSQELYESIVIQSITLSERYINDFAMHIITINGNDVDYKEAIDFIDDLDVSVYEDIFEQWESKRAKCSFNHKIKCDKCNNESEYSFEDMKDFYPVSWNI